ncbi:chorismate-binding protein [Vibrio sp. UCD-FRSSP16_10]|uniref:chromate efflux transporter n=1 Tax=unclassified Vibrio TaxID=2614977 RepID=UPI00080062D8|nr:MULTISPECIES: chromate efflux transporter [unclassified Vibrio]OBT16986.1 chorismate-binding protein [Vibrio sp. UCD-FRSSP16_30]OBT21977.1 chorismate-binding protein [Vibrio sp. UCD-FRSSP16_10]
MFSIFKIFFALGWVSFGGPAAHIGYFRKTFVEQKQWLSDDEYAQLVALSQFLPGPGSSQVGFALGYKQGGIGGAFAAFFGFTLPSVLLMLAVALLSSSLLETSLFISVIHALKLMAVVVVADAIVGMYKSFCQTKRSVLLCLFVALTMLLVSGIFAQILVLLCCAVLGSMWFKPTQVTTNTEIKKRGKFTIWPVVIFAGVLLIGPFVASQTPLLQIFHDFFYAGSLVFGGGHVVLPLLQSLIGEQLTTDTFLTGYAAAQAVPGPMFTFATYLGYELLPQQPIIGALVATMAVFLPGFLLVLSVIHNWQALASIPRVSAALKGVNAGVVGLLIAALYQPIFVSAVNSAVDFAVVLVGYFLLKQMKLPIVALVASFIGYGLLSALF